jgi:dTDP-4-amino-4,6-dideoxygalactose transaminase
MVIDYNAANIKVPFAKINDEIVNIKIKEKISKVIEKENFILGDEVFLFENNFKNFCNLNYCVGVGNGTDAIEIALRAAGISKNDKVIVPVNTFAATALAVIRVGAIPVFVDCDNSHLIDIDKINCGDAKAIIPVHLYGQMVDILKIKNKVGNEIKIIEDGAQSHGSTNNGLGFGSIGDIVATSFYPTKNLGCYGDGGAVLTNSSFYYEKVKELRNYGSKEKYHHDVIGFNSRLDEIQAAILNIKLEFLNEQNLKRINAANVYDNLLFNFLNVPIINKGNTHIYHLYVIEVDNREYCIEKLKSVGIETKIHYPIPLHLQPAFSFLGYKNGDFPNSERLSKRIISLPMFPNITKEQQEFVAFNLRKCYESM